MSKQQSTPPKPSSVGLDLLRGLAALAVLTVHVRNQAFVVYSALPAGQKGIAATAFFALSRIGREAVLVFFALSGFLVFGALVQRLRDGRFDLAAYALDRATRILLPLIPAVLLTAAVGYWILGSTPDPWQLAINMTGLNGVLGPVLEYNGALWTLAYEIWFYILAGAMAAVVVSERRALALAVLVIAASVFCVLEARYLLLWLLGAAAIEWRKPSGSGWLALAGAAVSLAGVALYEFGQESVSITPVTVVPLGVAEMMVGAGVILAIPWLCLPETNARLRFLARPAGALAAISYSLYLTNCPVIMALSAALPTAPSFSAEAWINFAIRIAACLAVAVIFYLLFERNTGPVRRWLRPAGPA